jgi:hypothetical protein
MEVCVTWLLCRWKWGVAAEIANEDKVSEVSQESMI